ncbi:MAG: DUF5723 family protein [Bacteroidota bacterium]|nr:DUF5723 family protein [Bacteroidota bacterium]
MKKKYLFILVTALSINIYGQYNFTTNDIPVIPQSTYLNPALMPTCRVYIGLPLISSNSIYIAHTGFNPYQVLETRNDTTFINVNSVVNKLAKKNYLFQNNNIELLSFSFKIKNKHYFSFNIMEKINTWVSYSKNLVEFAYKGNGALLDKSITLNPALDFSYYREYALCYAMNINDKISVGARLKLLSGKININSGNTDIKLITTGEMYDITAIGTLELNTSMPEEMRDTNYINNFDSLVDNTDFVKDFILLKNNLGGALDLGFTFKPIDNLIIGLSIIDLGFINWKNDPLNFINRNENASFTFTGVDVAPLIAGSDSLFDERLDDLLDSIKDVFDIDSTYNSYTTWLPTKIYLTASYDITPKTTMGVGVHLMFLNKSVYPAFHFKALHKFSHIFQASINYTIANRNYTNLGFGFALTLSPFQFYLTTDNILGPLIYDEYQYYDEGDNKFKYVNVPHNLKYLNVHLGINLVFGCKAKKYAEPSIRF